MKYKTTSKDPRKYYTCYTLIQSYNYSQRHVLWKKATECFFCGRSMPVVTFRNKAHAVSKLLDSKLLNADECDECNQRFSGDFENQLGLFLNPLKSMVISGKHKHKDHDTLIYNREGKLIIHSQINSIDEEHRLVHFTMSRSELHHFRIFCAFLKMGMSVFPRDLRNEATLPLQLLLGIKSVHQEILQSSLFYLWGVAEDKDGEHTIELYRNQKEKDRPQFILWIQYNRFYFQIYIPGAFGPLRFFQILNEIPIKCGSNPTEYALGPIIEFVHKVEPKQRIQFTIQSLDPILFDTFIREYRRHRR